MKPGSPATDLLASLLKTSLDSHASFTCETEAKQLDPLKKTLRDLSMKDTVCLKVSR